jgi:hypothetical protein
MEKLILEQENPPGNDWERIASAIVQKKQNEGCTVKQGSDVLWYLKKGSCPQQDSEQENQQGGEQENQQGGEQENQQGGEQENQQDNDGEIVVKVPHVVLPDLSKIQGLIINAWGRITSWFGKKVDDTGEWMKDKFTKSDIERAQEDCFKVPFKDEESAKKSLESGDILDYYQLKDTSGNTIFLGKAWDCENKGGMPPCFKNLSGGKYNSSSESYTEEYFEEFEDAGVYEYFCNGTVSFKPYYESDETGGYVESDRPKVWYKWDPKTGVINKS